MYKSHGSSVFNLSEFSYTLTPTYSLLISSLNTSTIISTMQFTKTFFATLALVSTAYAFTGDGVYLGPLFGIILPDAVLLSLL